MAGAHAYTTSYVLSSLGDSQPIVLDQETFDTDNYHDNSTNPERLTLPRDGQYLAFGYIQWPSFTAPGELKYTGWVYSGAGSMFQSGVGGAHDNTHGSGGMTSMAVIQGSAADYVELAGSLRTAGAPDDVAAQASIAYFGTATPLCFCHFVEFDQSATSFSALTMTAEDIDPFGMHSTVSNQSRITVPNDGNYLIMFSSGLKAVGGNPALYQEIYVNGSAAPNASGAIYGECDEQIGNRAYLTMLLTPLSAGDYVEVYANQPVNVNFGQFAVMQIDAQCCCAYVTSNQGPFTGSTWTTIDFGGELVDTSGFHDNSTNNSRLTAPVDGDYLIHCTNRFTTASGGGVNRLRFRKNGSSTLGIGDTGISCVDYYGGSFTHAIIQPLAAGDYVEVQGWMSAPHPTAPGVESGDCNFGIIRVTGRFPGNDFIPQIYRRN